MLVVPTHPKIPIGTYLFADFLKLMYIQMSRKWRTHYLLPDRGCLMYMKKIWKKINYCKNDSTM
jgi:hypothetical protein